MPIKKVLGSVKCVKLVHINPTQDKLSVFRVPMEPRQGIEFITLSNPNELKQKCHTFWSEGIILDFCV